MGWLWVNSTGGIGDYSVAIVDGYDTQYNPAKMIEGFALQKDDVAAFAMTLGSVQTQFILEAMDESDTISAPMSWWSGKCKKGKKRENEKDKRERQNKKETTN